MSWASLKPSAPCWHYRWTRDRASSVMVVEWVQFVPPGASTPSHTYSQFCFGSNISVVNSCWVATPRPEYAAAVLGVAPHSSRRVLHVALSAACHCPPHPSLTRLVCRYVLQIAQHPRRAPCPAPSLPRIINFRFVPLPVQQSDMGKRAISRSRVVLGTSRRL